MSPDDQVACAGSDWGGIQDLRRFAWVFAGIKSIQPFLDAMVEAGDALESPLVRRDIVQIQDTLYAKRHGLMDARIPM